MAREGLMDDCGYDFFDASECSNYENCSISAYQQGRADAIDECIQSIKDNWYFWNIGVIAEVIKKLEQLKEQSNE